MSIKEATDKLAGLIGRLDRDIRPNEQANKAGAAKVYKIDADSLYFSRADLGGLTLTDEDAKEYRQCVEALYKRVASKTEHMSRSAIQSLVQTAILKAVDPIQADATRNFPKRLESALADLKEELNAKPRVWEVHFPVDLLAEKLPYTFGKCQFYLGDDTTLDKLLERIDRVVGSALEGEAAEQAKQSIRERTQELVRGRTWVSILTDAVDGEAAQRTARKRVRQTVDILNFYANLGERSPSQVLLVGDPQPGILNTFLFSEDLAAFHPPSERVGPMVPFSFAVPYLDQVWFERMSGMLKKQAPSEFEDRVISAFQWAGRASVEPRKAEAFLLFAIALESLLMERNDKSEIAETLGLRGAHVIGGNAQSRLTVYKDLKRLYRVRSRIVHSGSVEVGEDQLSEIRFYARVALLTMLGSSRFSGISTDEELTDWFRSRLLDAKTDPSIQASTS